MSRKALRRQPTSFIDDLESLLYVIFWITCTHTGFPLAEHFLLPHDEEFPQDLRDWMPMDLEAVTLRKDNLLGQSKLRLTPPKGDFSKCFPMLDTLLQLFRRWHHEKTFRNDANAVVDLFIRGLMGPWDGDLVRPYIPTPAILAQESVDTVGFTYYYKPPGFPFPHHLQVISDQLEREAGEKSTNASREKYRKKLWVPPKPSTSKSPKALQLPSPKPTPKLKKKKAKGKLRSKKAGEQGCA